jgi:hypothetical protein
MSACNYILRLLYLPQKRTARPSRCWLDVLRILERKIGCTHRGRIGTCKPA